MTAEEILRRIVDEIGNGGTFSNAGSPFDYEGGQCYWCAGGWEKIGRKPVHTGKHNPDCPYQLAKGLLG